MKRILIFLALILPASAATVTVQFSYDFTGATLCSSSITMNCLDHFESGVLNGTTFTSMLTIPVPANATGLVSNITGSFKENVAFGTTVTFAGIIVAKDSAGNRITSDPTQAVASASALPTAPTAFSVVVK